MIFYSILFIVPFISGTIARGPNFGDIIVATEYIKDPQEAKNLLSVPSSFKGGITSYSGYLRVDQTKQSELFFWYFPAESNRGNEPILVWLAGGPGDQAVKSIFEGNGPFYVKLNRGLKVRQHYWSQTVGMLYIDSPVGSGFSSTKGGYATNLNSVARNLVEGLKQFYTIFSELTNRPLFIGGESWGAKQAIATAFLIHKSNINQFPQLTGLVIGNGFFDPINQIKASSVYASLGILSDGDLLQYINKENEIEQYIREKKYTQAFNAYDQLVKGRLWKYPTLFTNVTGLESPNNALGDEGISLFGNLEEYMEKDVTRRSIHVGTRQFHSDVEILPNLKDEYMQSVSSNLGVLLNSHRVLIYHGQFNMIVPYSISKRAVAKINWCGTDFIAGSQRKRWLVRNKLAGYISVTKPKHCAGELTRVLVRNSGRFISQDQPEFAAYLIGNFTHNTL